MIHSSRKGSKSPSGRFTRFTKRVTALLSQPLAFVAVAGVTSIAVISGLFYGWDNTVYRSFELVTSLGTFLLIFLLQHSQSRDAGALNLKLNELLRASEGAHNSLLDIESLSDRDYDVINREYVSLAVEARARLERGDIRWATSRATAPSLERLLNPLVVVTDPARLAALRRLAILDSPSEEIFDSLTAVAVKIFRAKIALVSLVDAERQWFKSSSGLPEPYCSLRETPLSHSYCKHVVASGEPLIIQDARETPLVRDSLAIRDLNAIAYAGVPLTTADGLTIGSFCVLDDEPRRWEPQQIDVLIDLANIAMHHIEDRYGGHVEPEISVSTH